jgi:polysaccharide export outer membrane protein
MHSTSATWGASSVARRLRRITAVAVLLTTSALAGGLAGCAAIPEDGPTPGAVNKAGTGPKAAFGLVTLDYATTQRIATSTPATIAVLAAEDSAAPNDLIAAGDEVSVSIFEAADGGLFARSVGATFFGPSPTQPQAVQEQLPRLLVDRNGDLDVPFGGTLHVAGLTPQEAAERIRRSLLGKSVDPQVNLVVTASRANSVGVLGAVRSPGHYPLAPAHDRLLDVLASAGGPTPPPGDAQVTVERNGHVAEASFSEIISQPSDNIRLAPKDEIRVVDEPRRFLTFGAVARPAEVPIVDPSLTLAGALARVSGLDTTQANAHWVMVFRLERPQIAKALGVTLAPTPKGVPIVYRLNLRDPQGFFVAANFDVEPQDVIYAARSDLSESRKFLDFVNTISQIDYNVTAAALVPR